MDEKKLSKYINLDEARKMSRKVCLKTFEGNKFLRGQGLTAEEFYKKLHKDEQTTESNKSV